MVSKTWRAGLLKDATIRLQDTTIRIAGSLFWQLGHPSRYTHPDCRMLIDCLRYGDPACRFLDPPSKMSRSGLPYLDFAFDASSDARQSDLWGLPPEWRSGLPYLEGSPNLAIQMPRSFFPIWPTVAIRIVVCRLFAKIRQTGPL